MCNEAGTTLRQSTATLESNPYALVTAIIGVIGKSNLDALAMTIIEDIGDMDGTLGSDQKDGDQFKRWLTRKILERHQKYRDDIPNMTPTDFKDFTKRFEAFFRNRCWKW